MARVSEPRNTAATAREHARALDAADTLAGFSARFDHRVRDQVYLDGKLKRTIDVAGEPRLYTLLDLPELRKGLLELRFAPGLEAYAFTFG